MQHPLITRHAACLILLCCHPNPSPRNNQANDIVTSYAYHASTGMSKLVAAKEWLAPRILKGVREYEISMSVA